MPISVLVVDEAVGETLAAAGYTVFSCARSELDDLAGAGHIALAKRLSALRPPALVAVVSQAA